jgi:lysyl-tRNA synthetase class 2
MNSKPNWQKLQSGEMDWKIFRLRENVNRAVRSFFQAHGFMEIESPLLTPYPTLDSNIHSIKTEFHDENGKSMPLFLHSSPEHSMKKLLSSGAERIFYLGKVFRDRELTSLHNPEFTMVEWYRTNSDYHDVQKDALGLICRVVENTLSSSCLIYQGKKIDLSPPWDRIPVRDLFMNHTGIDLEDHQTDISLKKAAERIGVHFRQEDDWETIFFRILLEKIEPHLGFPKPVFVVDYPAKMGLMAKRNARNPEWVERVELYIGGLELANGYSELTDPVEQRERFIEEQKKKHGEGHKNYPIDEELIHAMELGLPPCAGIALGLDRLIMILADKKEIQEVLPFPVCQLFFR